MIKRWSRLSDCCLKCGTIERSHRAKGLCGRCYDASRREWVRRYRSRHYREYHDVLLSRAREYRANHREERREYSRGCYASHREELREYYNKRRVSPKGKVLFRAYSRERKARRLRALGSHTVEEWWGLCRQYGYLVLSSKNLYVPCLCCGRILSFEDMTEDHVIPLSKGGTDLIGNIQPLCLSCNRIKSINITDFRRVS